MKKLACLFLVLSTFTGVIFAQQQLPENLTRSVLATVSENEEVDYGEFQTELQKSSDYKSSNDGYWFSFLYTVRNKYTDKANIMTNGSPLFVNRDIRVRTYRLGSSLTNSVFVIKSLDREAADIGYGMELVKAYGVSQTVCDSVLALNDDGFVYMQGGKCYYSPYSKVYDNTPKKEPVVWLERKVLDRVETEVTTEKAVAMERLSKGDVYFESVYGHYYYLFRDAYMPYSVLVVNNSVVELFDIYNEDNFKLKFSYNGLHWMAVGKECYWVDGEVRSIEGYAISDFLVTNTGHYGYKAYKIGAPERGEIVVVDGQIVRRNAKVNYFGLDAQGRLKFRFVTGGRTLQYQDESIADVSNELVSVYYPDDVLNGRKHVVISNNGRHKLTYQKDIPSVSIDGVKVAESVPYYAVYDEHSHSFVWNAVEERVGKTELVIYKYTVQDGFFKNLFK